MASTGAHTYRERGHGLDLNHTGLNVTNSIHAVLNISDLTYKGRWVFHWTFLYVHLKVGLYSLVGTAQ